MRLFGTGAGEGCEVSVVNRTLFEDYRSHHAALRGLMREDRSTDGMVDYNAHSAMQKQSVKSHANFIKELSEAINASGSEIRIVDYGCGPGASSVDTVRPAIEKLISRFPNLPITVCHADLPGNDWNALSSNVFGPDGYSGLSDNLRVETCIGSFYASMSAENSVDLGTCFTASHWLSCEPRINAPGTIWFADLVDDARCKMAAVAKDDWVRFLTCRSAELKPGGVMFISTLGAIPDPSEINGICSSARYFYRAIQTVAQSMVDDDLLDQVALDHFVFPFWFLTAEEARSAIEESEVLSKRLSIEKVEVVPAEVNRADIFAAMIEDPLNYGAQYSAYLRGFGESSLLKYLFEPSAKKGASARKLADIFFERFAVLHTNSPGAYAAETWYLNVQVRRV